MTAGKWGLGMVKQMLREKCQELVDVLVDSIAEMYENVYSKLPVTMTPEQKRDVIKQAMDVQFGALKKQLEGMKKINVDKVVKHE